MSVKSLCQVLLFSFLRGNVKKSGFFFVSSYKSRTFAVLLRRGGLKSLENRDVVQLVVYLVWDQVVARSSRVIPTNSRGA